MKTLLTFTLAALLCSCQTGGLSNVFVGYTGSGVEITGITGDASAAGYDLKAKQAYVVYAGGRKEVFKITGAGFGNHTLALYLASGGKVSVDTTTGKVTITAPEPALPSK